jgi:hypothetical protein
VRRRLRPAAPALSRRFLTKSAKSSYYRGHSETGISSA